MPTPTPTQAHAVTAAMSMRHAAVWLDHREALLIGFDGERHETRKLHAHSHATHQHGSEVRTVHEYLGHVCDALASFEWVLVSGSRTALADLRNHVAKHCPALHARIAGWETVDHPTPGQLVALGRHRRHEATVGVAGRS